MGVYGLVLKEERKAFRAKLANISGLWNDPWCIEGDFNMVRFLEEMRNCSSYMRRFSKIIKELNLQDLRLIRGPFTWCRV